MAAGRLTHTLALASRSIRADENRLLSHILRGGVNLFLVFLMIVAVADMGRNDAPGQVIFMIVAAINAVAVLLAGIAFFPSTITEEKEARTLGLLRMADVGPLAIIGGKVLPRLMLIVVLLVIQIPITLLAITLGGVTWEQVVQTFLALIISSITLCSIATVISIFCSSTRNSASLLVSLLIITPIAFGMMIWGIYELFGRSVADAIGEWMENWVLPASPLPYIPVFGVMGGTADTVWTPTFIYFTAVNLIVAGGFFFIGWLSFDRAIDTTGQSDLPRPVGLKLSGKSRSSRRSWSASIAWKDFWFIGGGYVGFTIRMLLYPILAIGLSLLVDRNSMVNIGDYLFGITIGCIPIEVAVLASRLFRHDLDNFTWSSLLMLPRTLGGVVIEKLWGAAIALVPSFFWLFFSFILDPELVHEVVRSIDRDPEVLFLILMWLAEFVMAALMITFFSLKSRYGAIPLTIFILIVGNITYFTFLFGLLELREVEGAFMFACFICFVISVVLLEQTRKTLVMLAARDS